MTTILKSVPGQPEVRIQYLNESLQFIGHNVESIIVDDVQYGHTLMLDEFDSLKEIVIRNLEQ